MLVVHGPDARWVWLVVGRVILMSGITLKADSKGSGGHGSVKVLAHQK